MRFPINLRATPKRREQVLEEIKLGSEPQGRFYALLIISTMIASFGLVSNSTAVIIGAMLVSPLMMPIFGIALGLLRGNTHLFWRAATAEVAGIMVAVGGAFLFGIVDITADNATAEMLARTQPNLIDLLVAIFAGFAGAFALVDERISPALPGVAIATAIVPPLATVGLCLAMGAYSSAFGALLLFVANMVAILVVALLTFTAAGFAPELKQTTWAQIVQRFGPTVVAFIVIAAILTNSLIRIVTNRQIATTIRDVITHRLADSHGVSMEQMKHKDYNGRVQILVTVRAPSAFTSETVKKVQDELSQKLKKPADLVVRTILSRDVAPTGSNLIVTAPNYNGVFLSTNISKKGAKIRLAEQVIREECQDEPGFKLVRVNYGQGNTGDPLVLATVESLRGFSVPQIRRIEDALQSRLSEPNLFLLIRSAKAQLTCRDGAIDLHWTDYSRVTKKELKAIPAMKQTIRDEIQRVKNLFATNVFLNKKENGVWAILAQVVGPVAIAPSEVELLRVGLAEKLKEKKVELNLWHRGDFVITSTGYAAFDDFTSPMLADARKRLPQLFPRIASR